MHSSGHGTRTEDLDGDEGDRYDEGTSVPAPSTAERQLSLTPSQRSEVEILMPIAICPLDYEQAGLIIDDESESILLPSLHP